jgi:heme/copper-type cytochrome/quinol oxidase subunit 2
MHTSNALDPQSPQARAIYDLGIVSTIVFVLIFVVVAGAIAYAIFRFRAREGEPEPKQFAGSKKVEIIWTVIPFLIVVFLFVLTLRGMNRADPPPAPSPDLVVTGHQFWWEAQYPASGAVTANEIHIPVGKPLSVRLDSKDVLHEFWVPKLARKMTTVPGQPNHIGYKPINRAFTSALARNFAARNTPGCGFSSSQKNHRSSKNGNGPNCSQDWRRQVPPQAKDWHCFRHQPVSIATQSAA